MIRMADESSDKGIRKCYDELSSKYNLPEYDEVEAELQISSFEDGKFLLNNVREEILDKLRDSTDFLSEILHPDTNVTNMHESSIFDNSQKNEFFALFKRLMFLRREAFEVYISGSETSTAEFINTFFEEWKTLKSELIGIISAVKNSWKAELEKAESIGYFG